MLVCVVLAALSAAILPTVPSYDPWSWIVWGREVTDPHMSFIVNGGPSWKPLPMIFTTIYGVLGGPAPTLWVITARIGGLLALWGTWKLTSRLAGGGWLGAFAGLLAAIGIVLTGRHDQAWYYYFLHGTSEAILVGVTVWAVDRILDGKHGQAYLLMVAGGLIRPEWWPFLGLYAIWLWFRHPASRARACACCWWRGWPSSPSAGSCRRGSPPASRSWPPPTPPTTTAIWGPMSCARSWSAGSATSCCPRSSWLWRPWSSPGCATATGSSWRSAAFIAGWWVVVVGETLDGYPGLERFFLPAAALTTVLGGVGLAELARLAGGLAGSLRRPVTAGVAVVLAAVCIPFSTAQISVARTDERSASEGVHLLDTLTQAVAAAGGKHGVLPCPSSFTAVNHSAQTALAWKLGVTLQRVGTSMRAPGVDFIGPHAAQIGGPAHVDPRLTHAETVATVGPWRVVRLTDPRLSSSACVGGG